MKCENYKKLSTPEEMRKGADDIWNTYLDTSSMHQINVDNKARSHCKEALQNPNNTMFEMAQNQVQKSFKILSLVSSNLYYYLSEFVRFFGFRTTTLCFLSCIQFFCFLMNGIVQTKRLFCSKFIFNICIYGYYSLNTVAELHKQSKIGEKKFIFNASLAVVVAHIHK